MSKFKVGQVWVTRDGRKARIVATDAKAVAPVLVLVESSSHEESTIAEFAMFYTQGGACYIANCNGHLDLIREHREPREWWVNLYSWGIGELQDSRDIADQAASGSDDRIECIRVREVIE